MNTVLRLLVYAIDLRVIHTGIKASKDLWVQSPRTCSMDEATLRDVIRGLEASRSSLELWLDFWTALVVVGVALEFIVIFKEYLRELSDFRRGTIHPPEKPSFGLLLLALAGVSFVAVGVGGELYVNVKAGKVETKITVASDQLVALILKEAGDAKSSAQGAAIAASHATDSAGAANAVAGKAQMKANGVAAQAEKLNRELLLTSAQLQAVERKHAELEQSLENLAVCATPRVIRSWTTSAIGGPRTSVDPLKRYAGLQAEIEFIPDAEARRAAYNIADSLREAGWKVAKLSVVDGIPDGVEVGSFMPPAPDKDASQDAIQAYVQTQWAADEIADALINFLHSYNWQARLGAAVHERGDPSDPKLLPIGSLRIRVGLYPAVFYVTPPATKELADTLAQERARIEKELDEGYERREREYMKGMTEQEAKAFKVQMDQRRKEYKESAQRDSRVWPCRPLDYLSR